MNRISAIAAWSVFVGLVGVLAYAIPAGSALEEATALQWLYDVRGHRKPPADVVIVAIDQQASSALGYANRPSEWPRNVHAELVRRLARAGPRVIAIDMTFDRPSAHDEELAAAIREAGNVVLVASLRRETRIVTDARGAPIASVVTDQIVPPVPALANAASGYAAFPLPRASRVDFYWTFVETGAHQLATFPVLAFHVYAAEDYRAFAPGVGHVGGANGGDKEGLGESSPSEQDLVGQIAMTRRRLQAFDANGKETATVQSAGGLVASLARLYYSEPVRYLDFYGPPRTIPTVRYDSVVRPATRTQTAASDADPALFADKAVFVGFSAASQPEQDRVRDDYSTVYTAESGLRLSGVEIAATAFGNLLENRTITELPAEWRFLAVFAWGALLTVGCCVLRPVPAVTMVALAVVAYALVAVRQFTVAAVLLPIVIPIGLQAPLAVFSGALRNYRRAKQERETIRAAFGHFLPAQVVDQLVKNVGQLTANNRLVYGTCLATDVEQYSALAENTEPTELARLMNDYFAAVFRPVRQRGGVVSDVVGDAVLAIWASANSSKELRRAACDAAIEVPAALARFNETLTGKPPFKTRIGLHSGEMMLGNVGAMDHYEYRAVGDIVNTATRIEGLNKLLGTQLLASASTLADVDDFVTRPLGSFVLAGKTRPVEVHELLGRRDVLGDAQDWLCSAFAEALTAYRAGHWQEASERLLRVLTLHPDDGPSHFYLRRCEQLVATPPGDGWEATVRLDTK